MPLATANVIIEAGQTVILDVATPALDCLRIEGTLVADQLEDVGITANYIEVMSGGTLQIGTAAHPFSRTATLTLTGPRGAHTARSEDNALDNDGIQRAIRVMNGGSLQLFGATPSLLKTKLAAHASAGATTFTLDDAVDWPAGAQIAISLTDFHGVGQTEVLTLDASSSGSTLHTTTGLQTFRWGLLQYPIDSAVNGSAMSLTQGTFTPATSSTPRVLDERAEVVNLSRRIVIQGANDADWTNTGFGVHVMVMGLDSVAQVRGVEFRRCGQRRAMGRYPFHWHMLSYTSANAIGQGGGTYRGDAVAANHFLVDSAIWNSQNRAVTIHGTCGVKVDNVYAVDVKGHAFFMEDGSEQRNTITKCVAMKVRDPGVTNRLKLHENPSTIDGGSSGFWITNPDNTITSNSGSDCDGRGLWNSFAGECFGLSRNATVNPGALVIALYEDNVGHSNFKQGIHTEAAVFDEAGTVYPRRYEPGNAFGTQFTLSRNVVWKNVGGGYGNRVGAAIYTAWTAADNNGRDFNGAALGAKMQAALLVCKSLNSSTPFADPRRIGVSSYHFELEIKDLTAINYQFYGPTIAANGQFVYGGGVFDSSDLYTYSIGLGGFRNTGWRLINSHAGFLTPAPYLDGFPLAVPDTSPVRYRHWSLPVTWDPHGYWGPAGNYLVPNIPFYNHGLSSSVSLSPAGSNGLSTPDVFYGLAHITVNDSVYQHHQPTPITLRAARLNASNIEVAEHTIGDPSVAVFFERMRSFSVAKGGRYRITFPNGPMPTTSLGIIVKNAYRSTDSILLGLPWQGSIPVAGRYDSGWGTNTEAQRLAAGTSRLFTFTGTSIASVLADPTGATAWQDTANNTAWVRLVGGLTPNPVGDGFTDAGLDRDYVVRLRPGP